jgi:hypothetical protein
VRITISMNVDDDVTLEENIARVIDSLHVYLHERHATIEASPTGSLHGWIVSDGNVVATFAGCSL